MELLLFIEIFLQKGAISKRQEEEVYILLKEADFALIWDGPLQPVLLSQTLHVWFAFLCYIGTNPSLMGSYIP